MALALDPWRAKLKLLPNGPANASYFTKKKALDWIE
jgi:hypothetical protein